jgi:hypothetical protein
MMHNNAYASLGRGRGRGGRRIGGSFVVPERGEGLDEVILSVSDADSRTPCTPSKWLRLLGPADEPVQASLTL